MARAAQKDLISRLADRGEEAIQRLGDVPGAHRLLDVANSLRDRIDELQKRLRGLDALEGRVAELERRLDKLAGKPSPARRAAAARKRAPAARAPRAAAKKQS